jgi:hypothetical protein
MTSFSFSELKNVTLQGLVHILLCTIQRKLENVQAGVLSLLKGASLGLTDRADADNLLHSDAEEDFGSNNYNELSERDSEYES